MRCNNDPAFANAAIRLTVLLVAGLLSTPCPAAKNDGQPPSMAQVEKVMMDHFRSQENWQARDLITQGDVKQLPEKLEQNGWKVPKWESIRGQMLSDSHFLVKQFRTNTGRSFMRKVNSYPLVYDRLDQFSEMAGGKLAIRDLVRTPRVHEYVHARGREGFVKITELSPVGPRQKRKLPKRIDKPTDKIYTVEALLEVIKKLHDQQG